MEINLNTINMSLATSVAKSYLFAQGWSRLPDELRLTVLTDVFAYNQDIDHAEYDKLLEHLYLPLLLTPHAGIATEALFAHNTFKISFASKRYPPPAQNTWIRRMEIELTNEEAASSWSLLEKLCTGSLGFERLCEIDMTLISNRKKGDTRGFSFTSMVDLDLPLQSFVPILANVNKLSITRKILFEDSVRWSIWERPVPFDIVQRAKLWDKICLEGEYTEEFPLPMGFIDLGGQLHTYRQLPFEEVAHPALGLTRKTGILQGFQQVRILTRKLTSNQSCKQSKCPIKSDPDPLAQNGESAREIEQQDGNALSPS